MNYVVCNYIHGRNFVFVFKMETKMKSLLLIFTFSACMNMQAAPNQVLQHSDNQLEQAKSFSFSDKKKSRKYKRANSKRKRSCANWAKSCYAG